MLAKIAAIAKSDAALVAGAVQAILALIVAFGFSLSAGETGAIEGVVAGVLALIVAVATTPFRVSALTGFVTVIGTLLIAFQVPHVTSGLVSAVNAVLAGLVLLGTHVVTKLEATAAAPAAVPAEGVHAARK